MLNSVRRWIGWGNYRHEFDGLLKKSRRYSFFWNANARVDYNVPDRELNFLPRDRLFLLGGYIGHFRFPGYE
jgi:hypothetical protein